MKTLHASVAAGVFGIALAVYVATLAPTVGLVDSGALTVASWGVGNAHPPGFPLYLMLTKLATLLPIGTVAWRANLGSALFAALACSMVSLAIREALLYVGTAATPSAPRVAKVRQKDHRHRAASLAPIDDRVIAMAMALGGLSLAFGRTLWAYATVTEVYALNTLLVATIVWLMLAWRRSGDIRRLYAASLVFGLALGVHHVTVGLTLFGIAVLVLRTAGVRFFRSRQLAVAAMIAIVAFLAVYAYLPIAASREPALNWGDPDNLTNFVRHVTAKQYRVYVRTDTQDSQIGDITRLVSRELGPRALPAALLLALFGLVRMFTRDRSLFWLLTLMIAGCCAWMIVYPIVNDEDAYLLPAFVAIVIAAAFGVASLIRKPALAAAFLVLPLLAAVAHWPYRDRSEFLVAKDYVENTLRGIEPNSLLITNDWQLWAPMFYFQQAERVRPDVISIEYGMLIRSWYVDQLVHQHPALFTSVRAELDAYRPLMHINENDPARWADPAIQMAYNARLDDLVFALIAAQIRNGGHVYATSEVAMSREPVDQNLVRRIAAAYDVVPRGVALELLPGHEMRDVKLAALNLRGLADGTIRYEPDDVVVTEVRPAYSNVLLLRARYLALNSRFDEALTEYRRALELDPGNGLIPREIQAVEMRKSAS